MAARPEGRHRGGRRAPFRADELDRLDRRPPRLAGAALSPLPSAGSHAARRYPARLHHWWPDEHAIAREDARSLAFDHEGHRAVPRSAHDEEASRRSAFERKTKRSDARVRDTQDDLPLLV